MQQRNIGLCILLSILTCGIYSLYWFVVLTDDVNRLDADVQNTSGGTALVLALVTCGIYSLYWMYKQGEKIDNVKTSRGIAASSSGIVYLLLGVFGLGIVAYALMQSEINKLV